MKKITSILILFCAVLTAIAQKQPREIVNQTGSETKYELGSGVTIVFEDIANNGKKYKSRFFIGGNIAATYFANYDIDNEELLQSIDMNRARFTVAGDLYNGKFGFFLQTDFSEPWALLDAYCAYNPFKSLSISFGQRLINTNNPEANTDFTNISFITPGLLTETISGDYRREFGLFIDGKFMLGGVGFKPSVSITSGDGRNSFGSSGTYYDEGGLKYGGRLNILPLGFFTNGNDFAGADLAREESLKISVGGAASVNQGANHPIGDGHQYWDTEHPFYNSDMEVAYANYVKLYLDFILKYKGISVIYEFGQSVARSYKNLYTDAQATVPITPGRISEYYYLGTGHNAQLGYLFKNNWGIDVRYGIIQPEFELNSLLTEASSYSLGISKYIKSNKLKLQSEFSYLEQDSQSSFGGGLMIQVIF